MYDVMIIGAGPAGSNLARLIGDRYRVLVIDKRDLERVDPNGHGNKCCGGLLAPDAQKVLARLGLGIPKEVLVDPQLFAVRAIDLTNNMERLYQRFYLNMDREKFDGWLVSILQSTVDRKFNCLFKGFERIPEGFRVACIHNGNEITVRTRVIIGADGASSRVRHLIGKGANPPDEYISIQEWYECSDRTPYFTAVFDEDTSDFYSWIIPKGNHLLLGSALVPRENPRKRMELLKAKLMRRGFVFGVKVKTEGAYILRPTVHSRYHAGIDGIALVGEAAGAISPSSAEGISYALRSSICLARGLDGGLDGFLDRYKRNAWGIGLNLFMNNLKCPAMYNPFFRRCAMASGLLSIK